MVTLVGGGCGGPASAPATVDPLASVVITTPSHDRHDQPKAGEPGDDGPPLTPEEVRLVVRAKLPEIRGCFEAGLRRSPEIGGRVLLRFTINSRGKPENVRVVEDHLGEAAVSDCIIARLAEWQFPRPRGGASIEIAYPFVFSSEDSLRAAGLPRVEGTVKPAAVGAVFDAHRSEIDVCIPDGAGGSIGVAFHIDDGGAVTRISSYESSLPDDAHDCVIRTVSSWLFPPAASGDVARVNHDLRW